MRSITILFGLVAVVTLPLAACEDSSASASSPDAGGVDAAVPSNDASAPPNDAQPQPDAPAKGGLTVRVLSGRAPSADVPVVFHDASGMVTGTAKTDATGTVTAAVAPSQVTVLRPLHFITYVGVANGDELVVDDPGNVEEVPTVSYAITLPGAFGGAAYYQVSSSECTYGDGDPTMPIAMLMYKPCLATAGGTVPILASAEDESGATLAYAFKKGNANPTAMGTPVSVGAWASPVDVVVTGSNLPGGTTRAALMMIGDGRPFEVFNAIGSLGTGLTFKTAGGFAEAIQANVTLRGGLGERVVGRRQAPAAQMAIDAAQALPAITGASVNAATTKRPEVTWTSASPLNAADGGLVTVSWSVQVNPDQLDTYQWSFVVPPTATSVKAPELPSGGGPSGTVQISSVAFGESDLVPDYGRFKALPVDVARVSIMPWALPANGTLRTTQYGGD